MSNAENKIIDEVPTLAELNQIVSDRLKTVKNKRNKDIKQTDDKHTQKKIIDKTGLSKDVISRAFNGKGVSLTTALALCKYFNISMDYLFGASEYENTEQCERNYAIDTFKKHISTKKIDNGNPTKVTNVSEPLDNYLEVVDEHENIKTMSPELKKQWIQEAENEFLKVIDKTPTKFVEYEKS